MYKECINRVKHVLCINTLWISSPGSPKYFGSILHYLRTNNLELPSALNRQSLQLEAEFYGIQKIVDHLKHLESDKQNAESIKKSE